MRLQKLQMARGKATQPPQMLPDKEGVEIAALASPSSHASDHLGNPGLETRETRPSMSPGGGEMEWAWGLIQRHCLCWFVRRTNLPRLTLLFARGLQGPR